MSSELQRNLGEVLALLPLPSNESEVVSVDQSGSGYNVVLRLVGETDEVELQTRWKDRDGRPTLVEASHLSRTERLPRPEKRRPSPTASRPDRDQAAPPSCGMISSATRSSCCTSSFTGQSSTRCRPARW